MAEYYVVRDKNTGLYFRGKGVNRWGKYYNQASIYRIKANAENTIKEVSWRGEQAEIVPIQIVETTADVVPKSEVAELLRLMFNDDCACNYNGNDEWLPFKCKFALTDCPMPKERLGCWMEFVEYGLAELKKKYQEGE